MKKLKSAMGFFKDSSPEMLLEFGFGSILVDIACTLLSYRNVNGLSQRELSEGLGWSLEKVRNIEDGEHGDITLKEVYYLEKTLGIKIFNLITEQQQDGFGVISCV